MNPLSNPLASSKSTKRTSVVGSTLSSKSRPEFKAMIPDNSDMASSVSFNTNMLYDQFENMDSIS